MANLKHHLGIALSGVATAGGFAALYSGEWRFLILPLVAYLLVRSS